MAGKTDDRVEEEDRQQDDQGGEDLGRDGREKTQEEDLGDLGQERDQEGEAGEDRGVADIGESKEEEGRELLVIGNKQKYSN